MSYLVKTPRGSVTKVRTKRQARKLRGDDRQLGLFDQIIHVRERSSGMARKKKKRHHRKHKTKVHCKICGRSHKNPAWCRLKRIKRRRK